MLMQCVDFFIDELIWMVAWGWYQLIFGIIISWLMFIFLGRMRFLPALFFVLSSYMFAVVIYFGFVSCILINFFEWKFVPGQLPNVYSPLDASLILGSILSVLQLFFYVIVNYWRPLLIINFFMLSLISNLLAAYCSSFFIKFIL